MSVPLARRDGWGAGASLSRVVRQVRLEGNLRYDVLNSHADSTQNSSTTILDVTDRRWSAETGVSRAFGPAEPYAHVASGFRAPNLDERYFNGNIHGGLRLFGNPDLVSERSRSYELGVRGSEAAPDWLRRARISAYRSDVDDLISFRYIGQLYLVPRFQFFNVNRARIEGLEGMFAIRARGVEVCVSGTLPRGRDLDTGEPLEDIGVARASVEVVVPAHRLLPQGSISTRVRWSDAVKGVDAMGTITQQQQIVRRLVTPYIDGTSTDADAAETMSDDAL